MPLTPPNVQKDLVTSDAQKPTEEVIQSVNSKAVVAASKEKKQQENSKPKIPGLPENWDKKTNKKTKNKIKKNDNVSKKVEDLTKADFLYDAVDDEQNIEKDFKFGDSSDEENFEDSKEALDSSSDSEDNQGLLTPSYKSIFAARLDKLDSKRKLSPDGSERNIRHRSLSVGTQPPVLKLRPSVA